MLAFIEDSVCKKTVKARTWLYKSEKLSSKPVVPKNGNKRSSCEVLTICSSGKTVDSCYGALICALLFIFTLTPVSRWIKKEMIMDIVLSIGSISNSLLCKPKTQSQLKLCPHGPRPWGNHLIWSLVLTCNSFCKFECCLYSHITGFGLSLSCTLCLWSNPRPLDWHDSSE